MQDHQYQASALSLERARVIAIPSKRSQDDKSVVGTLESGENILWVETVVQQSCSGCSMQSSCGHSLLGKLFSRRQQCIPVRCRSGEASLLSVGQWVEVGVPASMVVRASILAYMMPLLGLLLGAILFASVGPELLFSAGSDSWALVGATMGLLTGSLSAKILSNKWLSGRHLPRFVRSLAAER